MSKTPNKQDREKALKIYAKCIGKNPKQIKDTHQAIFCVEEILDTIYMSKNLGLIQMKISENELILASIVNNAIIHYQQSK